MTEFRAGGTDLTERRRSGVSRGALADLLGRPLRGIVVDREGSAVLGALVTVDALAADPAIRSGWPGLAAAAAGLATPQIRRVATVGGNLLQHNRCWYYRHPATACLRKGGTGCPARTGDHRHGVVFDLGPCVAPHPSTLGAALLAYDAVVGTDHRHALPVAEVFDPRAHHALTPDELLTEIRLPPPVAGERAGYRRAISRARAEWPLVEALARLVVESGTITLAAVTVGGVAPVPLRLPHVEAALTGHPATPDTLATAAALATRGATPLPMTAYKLPLLTTTVEDALTAAAQLG